MTLDYARFRHRRRPILAIAMGAVFLVCGTAAAWSFAHSWCVVSAVRQVNVSQVIDFDDRQFGLPVEFTFPLGIVSGGIALVAFVQLVRLYHAGRPCHRF